MQLAFDSRRKGSTTLERAHPGAKFIDVTSKGVEPWVRLSPFYPHEGLPVPFSPDHSAASVEGVWQGLKVFESCDVDVGKFEVRTMRGIKRTVRKFGPVLGHRQGVTGDTILNYLEARRTIYLPTYRYILEHSAASVVGELRSLATRQPLVLLDYETNGDIEDLRRPLSHASLVVAYLQDRWPADATR